ncbi:hypothetical protein L211DRAFT_834475 [Terfezia boudieri ATCC MYA-4762]|uniref:Uncharacterized protein n=1 Tax=Terfezia boudieri ATCC MYA-4762 TaxID=1051890 RepID=A0A3N4LXN1_9PEZI|nr:hypothetical protein L211DRAFT_834475 [Terfezia boudieri ATCC MYA-4762]
MTSPFPRPFSTPPTPHRINRLQGRAHRSTSSLTSPPPLPLPLIFANAVLELFRPAKPRHFSKYATNLAAAILSILQFVHLKYTTLSAFRPIAIDIAGASPSLHLQSPRRRRQ